MNEKEFLTKQTEDAYSWTNKLIDAVPIQKWEVLPEVVESSISWQVGHLIMSHYFHTMMVISGHQMEVLQKVPIKDYAGWFTDELPKNVVGKASPNDLLVHLKFVQQKSLDILTNLSMDELNKPLEPTPIPHPIAKTKLESIDWNIKHTMYHCGQIGLIKKVIDVRYDFGLRK